MNERDAIHFIDLEFLGHPGVIGTGVLLTDRGIWLVDPGPATGLDGLRRGLAAVGFELGDVRGVLLTHIHLDHAGGTGTLLRERPDIPVYVHEVGAPHMIDPSRLLQSAGRLYAGDLSRLWGEVAPVPAGNVRVLKGGEHLDLDGRIVDVAYTPGHASHHVSYFDTRSASALVGDTGGVRLSPAPHILPPTPPPDIDLGAWSDSISRIRAWDPACLYVTHFGRVDRPDTHLTALEQQLYDLGETARSILEAPGTDEERQALFVDRVGGGLRQVMPADQALRYQLAIPLEHCWLGLVRYWRRKASISPS
jgi:glyoxylase-like metal-dependent hydrolase (beta-lactamase superfamily II)